MQRPALIILAAGLGSRYGGLKQIDPIGPAGEIILDYSIYDAIRAGFDRVVLIVSRELRTSFQKHFGRRFETRIAATYVCQTLDDLPSGFNHPPIERSLGAPPMPCTAAETWSTGPSRW